MHTPKKVFCENCRTDVEYTVESVSMNGSIKNEHYQYSGKEAHCVNCGALLYVPEINDFNLESIYEGYRRRHQLISLAQVREIPKKYAIGKRPLSLLLGWGEQTLTRYCEGDVPTKQYSDILQRIYNDPQFYSDLLERNKERLKSAHSYEKSRKAVEALKACHTNNPNSKINFVMQYMLNQCGDITPLALQKALYYIQGFYYAFYKKFIFEEDCRAEVYGPVYKDIYHSYRDYQFDPAKEPIPFDPSSFSRSEKEMIDSVIDGVCCYSGKVLEQFTQKEKPWCATEASHIIEKEMIGDYFYTVKAKYNMVNPGDIKAYTQDRFLYG